MQTTIENNQQEIRVERDDSERCLRAGVYPFEGNRHSLKVYLDREWPSDGGQWKEPLINWSALGSVSIETARQYALAILKACEVAEQMKSEVPSSHSENNQ